MKTLFWICVNKIRIFFKPQWQKYEDIPRHTSVCGYVFFQRTVFGTMILLYDGVDAIVAQQEIGQQHAWRAFKLKNIYHETKTRYSQMIGFLLDSNHEKIILI